MSLKRLWDGLFVWRWLIRGADNLLRPVAKERGVSDEQFDYALQVVRAALLMRGAVILLLGVLSSLGVIIAAAQYFVLKAQTNVMIEQKAEMLNQTRTAIEQRDAMVEQIRVSRLQVEEATAQNEYQRRTELMRIIYDCAGETSSIRVQYCPSPKEAAPLRSLAIAEYVAVERARIDKLWRSGALALPYEARANARDGATLRASPAWRRHVGIDCRRHWHHCVMLPRVNLEGLNFLQTDLSWVYFGEATLARTVFVGTDLSGTEWLGAVASSVSFDDAKFDFDGFSSSFPDSLPDAYLVNFRFQSTGQIAVVKRSFKDCHDMSTVAGHPFVECRKDPKAFLVAHSRNPWMSDRLAADMTRVSQLRHGQSEQTK